MTQLMRMIPKMGKERMDMCKIRFNPQPVAAVMLTAVLAGCFPVTAFANTGKEADCICETRCTEETVNDQCPVCEKDSTLCQGAEPEKTEEEPEDKREETVETETKPEDPLTPKGNMNLVDDYGDHETSGKQFITLTTKNGNYFYLIIDRDDSGNETVHFLNQVDEADLLSLMDEDDVKEYTANEKAREKETDPESSIIASAEPKVETKPAEEESSSKRQTKVPVGTLLLLISTGFALIGAYVYKKVGKKNRKNDQPDPDADYQESGEEDYLKELEDDGNLEEDGEDPENSSDV